MSINPLGALLPAAGLASGSGILPQAAGGIAGAALGGGASLGNLTNELASGLSDDTSSMNMLSQLATTLGNLASSLGNSGSSGAFAGGMSASGGVSVPSPTSSGQQFRSYSSLQQPQQGASNSDATLASLISGGASGDGDGA